MNGRKIDQPPPPLQPILRLQRTIGNQRAQRILGIGDGVRVEVVEAAPEKRSLSSRLSDRLRGLFAAK
jgi:hypothetical protein